MAGSSPSSVIDKILSGASNDVASTPQNAPERFFDSIGLMSGSYAPVWRACFGMAVGSIFMFALRPSFAFNSDGSPKPWGKDGAAVPWYTIPITLGVVCGVFI